MNTIVSTLEIDVCVTILSSSYLYLFIGPRCLWGPITIPCADLTDVTLAAEDNNSIPTDYADISFQVWQCKDPTWLKRTLEGLCGPSRWTQVRRDRGTKRFLELGNGNEFQPICLKISSQLHLLGSCVLECTKLEFGVEVMMINGLKLLELRVD